MQFRESGTFLLWTLFLTLFLYFILKLDICFGSRSEFPSGTLSVAQLSNKVTLTVGTGLLALIYDLYETKASEKKVEMQALVFRLADNVTELTEKLKGIL